MGGGWVKKVQKTVHMVCAWPPSKIVVLHFSYLDSPIMYIAEYEQEIWFTLLNVGLAGLSLPSSMIFHRKIEKT